MKLKINSFLRKKKKFCPFFSNNLSIYKHYNTSFKLPKCFKRNKKCSCFPPKKEIEFTYTFPMTFIYAVKKHIVKNLKEVKKHNNMLILQYDKNANISTSRIVDGLIIELLKTIFVFEQFFDYSIKLMSTKKARKFKLYKMYLNNQKKNCLNFSKKINFQKIKIFSFTCSEVLLYTHYHTLKLFESFVNKI